MKRKIRPLRQKRPAVIHLRTDTPKQLYSILFEMYARAVDPYIIPAMGEIKLRDLKIPQTCINTSFFKHEKSTIPTTLCQRKQCFVCAFRGSNPGHPD